jgi:CRP-like cAMP-binding protein
MPYGKLPRQLERGRSNRFLAALPPHDFALLTPHLRTVTLERGMILHDAGNEIERVYFLHSGMVSVVALMQSGAAVETATIGRAGVIGASTGLGVKYSSARVIVQLPGTAAWLSASQFHAAANGSQAALQRRCKRMRAPSQQSRRNVQGAVHVVNTLRTSGRSCLCASPSRSWQR